MADVVRELVPLATPWVTADPFLFCAHHVDDYPAADERLGPAAALDGRDLGNDFAGIDGWRMYHGLTVPGFPQHPHRGFETVTYVRRGLIDHSDSLGATARYGGGDVQWLTAGAGVSHSEMFPLLDPTGPNPLELFQIWLNLPRADKLAQPRFAMLWDGDVPRRRVTDEAGRASVVTVVAGDLDGLRPPAPPPASWASRPDSDVAIWHVSADAGATVTLPPAAGDRTGRTLYVHRGSASVDGTVVPAPTGAAVDAGAVLTVTAGDAGCEALVLQGRPIGEPVARYGPFVMNDRAGVEQAFEDYRANGFGGWPWPADDPVHGPDPARFARFPDGRVERPGAA